MTDKQQNRPTSLKMYSRWSIQRLEKLRSHYESLLQKALTANPEDRKRLIAITRRSRKRLSKIGIIIRDQPGGRAQYYQRGPTQTTNLEPDLINTKRIVSFIKFHNLGYGTANSGDPSWAIPLNTYRLPSAVADFLSQEMPGIIGEYATECHGLINSNLSDRMNSVGSILLYGVPDAALQLWREFTLHHSRLPYCIRPDLLLERSGRLRAIEFNVDSRLDRGIAYGVSSYSADLLDQQHERLLANDLTIAYAEAARGLAQTNVVNIATIYNPECRAEYSNQEDFFCRAITENRRLFWNLLPINKLLIDTSSGFIVERDTGQHLDVVALELELIDGDGNPRQVECDFIERVLSKCTRTRILGSILPYADKLLLALVSSNAAVSKQLKTTLMPTGVLGDEIQLDSMTSVSLEELKQCPSHQQHYVLKRTGVHLDSTGSKSVVICSDVKPDVWLRVVDQAMNEVQSRKRGWVVQPRAEPAPYHVRYKLRPRGHTREDDCFVRLSAFYVLNTHLLNREEIAGLSYSLAGAVATAGTDKETLKRHLYTIKALRQSTYMAVTINSSSI